MSENFNHRFTVLPDSGVIELHCSTHHPSARHWPVGYHPSLDVLIEHAHAHNLTEHAGENPSGPSRLAGAIAAAQQPAKRVPELGAVAYEAAETGVLREQLAAADRATAEFRRQCSELAGELGAARAVVREMDAHIASGDDYAAPAKRAEWRQRAGIGDGQ